jgi:TPR repeat protein
MTDKSRFRQISNALYRRFRAANTQPLSLRRIYQGLLAGLMLIVLLNGYAFGQFAVSLGSYKAARLCYGVAAWFGNSQARNNLAGLYADGLGGPRDDRQAARLFQQAADSGITQAKFNLASFYEEGRGVARHIDTAIHLFEAAAADDDVDAAYNLGHLHASGRDDLPRDPVKALNWYRQAADLNHASAQFNLAGLYIQGVDVSKCVDLAINWYTRAAQQGHAKAQLELGTLYAFGVGVGAEVDLARGIIWLRRARAQAATAAAAGERLAQACKAAEGTRDAALPGCLTPP